MGRQATKRGDFSMQRTRHWLVLLQSAHDAALWARPDRSGIEIRVKAWLAAVALTGIAWCQPAAAAVCRVPAAVLCEGCVERLSIRIAPGGTCRISFSPASSREQTGAIKFVDIIVEAVAPRATIHRLSLPHPSVGSHTVPARVSPACFVFNGRHFCE
jgi:hypothetical protein